MKFPEPLYESVSVSSKRVCLVCGKAKAVSCLRTTYQEIVPLCDNCSKDWTFHRYNILKRIKFKSLLFNIFLFKLKNWEPSFWTIFKDIRNFRAWSKVVKDFKKGKR